MRMIPAQPNTFAVYDDDVRKLVVAYDVDGSPLVHGKDGNLRKANSSLTFLRIEEPTGG